ncbi:MAG: hypothetical protein EU539_01030 [Promethearchaeota archaeon]|nr:MAG: hypothetical protein EU539_01030 [Candidatus Lokiarchaeota archaeon]
MKKVSYALNFALVGLNDPSINSGKRKLLEYLNEIAVKHQSKELVLNFQNEIEFLIVFQGIPIKIKLISAENFDDLIYRFDKINHLDVVVLLFSIYHSDTLNEFKKLQFEELIDYYGFQGTSALIGLDLKEDSNSTDMLEVRQKIIEKSKELSFLYGFEIRNGEQDISEFYEVILSDFIFKFKSSSQEMFEMAKIYGNELKSNGL